MNANKGKFETLSDHGFLQPSGFPCFASNHLLFCLRLDSPLWFLLQVCSYPNPVQFCVGTKPCSPHWTSAKPLLGLGLRTPLALYSWLHHLGFMESKSPYGWCCLGGWDALHQLVTLHPRWLTTLSGCFICIRVCFTCSSAFAVEPGLGALHFSWLCTRHWTTLCTIGGFRKSPAGLSTCWWDTVQAYSGQSLYKGFSGVC